jgi:hypothetical protein
MKPFGGEAEPGDPHYEPEWEKRRDERVRRRGRPGVERILNYAPFALCLLFIRAAIEPIRERICGVMGWKYRKPCPSPLFTLKVIFRERRRAKAEGAVV